MTRARARSWVAACAGLVACLAWTLSPVQAQEGASTSVPTLAQPVGCPPGEARGQDNVALAVDAVRAAAGLAGLARDGALDAAARAQACALWAGGPVGHRGADGTGPSDRARAAGSRCALVWENLAVGPLTSAQAMRGWVSSEGHRRAMLDPRATHQGVAVVVLPTGGVVWVHALGGGC